MKHSRGTYRLIETKTVFKISMIVVILTILGVYFWGLGVHHTFFENSMISTTILSITFFLFITTGLYRGVKLRDNLGNLPTGPIYGDGSFDLASAITPDGDFSLDVGEGIAGIIVGILLWILYALVLAIVLWIFSNVVLLVIAAFVAMLYWIFFRALRLVFKNSNRSKGRLLESIRHGFLYTVLYNFWIYGIFILVEYLRDKGV